MDTQTKSEETQEILNDFFQLVGQRDTKAIVKYFADTTDFYISKSPILGWTGRQTTPEGVGKAMQMLFDTHVPDKDKFEMDRIFIDGEEAAVFGTVSRMVYMTTKTFEAPFTMRFSFKNGLITKLLMLEDSRKIEEAFIM